MLDAYRLAVPSVVLKSQGGPEYYRSALVIWLDSPDDELHLRASFTCWRALHVQRVFRTNKSAKNRIDIPTKLLGW